MPIGDALVPVDDRDYGLTQGIPYSSRRQYAQECREMVAGEFDDGTPAVWRGILEIMILTTPLARKDDSYVLVNLHAGEFLTEYLRKSTLSRKP